MLSVLKPAVKVGTKKLLTPTATTAAAIYRQIHAQAQRQVPGARTFTPRQQHTLSTRRVPNTGLAPPTAPKLHFIANACNRASPDKPDRRGEDAWFIDCDSHQSSLVIGVADGVGGWSSEGIDAGAYARELMGFAQTASRKAGLRSKPKEILHDAWVRIPSNLKGSCTACIVAFKGSTLHYANLGDSGLFGWRSGLPKPFVRSKEQQHRFNCPFQLGHGTGDKPEAAQVAEAEIQRGDIIVLATDGFFDNLFDDTINNLITQFMAQHRTRQEFRSGWPKTEQETEFQQSPTQPANVASTQSSTTPLTPAEIAASISTVPTATAFVPETSASPSSAASSSASCPRSATPLPQQHQNATSTAAGSSHASPLSSLPDDDTSFPLNPNFAATPLTLDAQGLQDLADYLVEAASKAAAGRAETPFSQASRRIGRRFQGGKQDDITVVVAQVLSSEATAESPGQEHAPGVASSAVSL